MRTFLYERDGATLVTEILTAEGISVRAADDQGIRGAASFEAPLYYSAALRRMGRQLIITANDGTTRRFTGFIDDVQPAIDRETWVSVQCRDKGKVFNDRFAEDVTYEDASAASTTVAFIPAATTELAAGDEIQGQGRVYDRTLEAMVLGITSSVSPSSESGDIRAGTYSIDYQADGLSGLRLTVYLDLLAQETIQSITVTTTGIAATTQISTDGQAWADFSAGATGRYLKLVISKAAGPITAGVSVTTGAAAPASNINTDNAASWRPRPTDLDRQLTIAPSAGAATVNVLYLKCGVSDLDHETAYRVDIATLSGSTWTTQLTNQLLVAGMNELALPSASVTAVRVTFKSGNAPFAVRYAQLKSVTSTVTIDQIIKTILGTEGETDFSLIQATRQTAPGNALTLEAGQEKLAAMVDLAASIGWEFFYNTGGQPVFRPRNWADPAGDLEEFAAVLNWQPTYTDADIYNQVLCLYEAGDLRLWSTAKNDSGASSTSTVNIGTRTSPVLRNPLADTQAKLDAWAQEQLAQYSRQATPASLSTPRAPDEAPPEPGALVHIVDGLTGTDAIFRVKSAELVGAADSLDLRLEVVEL